MACMVNTKAKTQNHQHDEEDKLGTRIHKKETKKIKAASSLKRPCSSAPLQPHSDRGGSSTSSPLGKPI